MEICQCGYWEGKDFQSPKSGLVGWSGNVLQPRQNLPVILNSVFSSAFLELILDIINFIRIDFEVKWFMFGILIWEVILTKIKKVKT